MQNQRGVSAQSWGTDNGSSMSFTSHMTEALNPAFRLTPHCVSSLTDAQHVKLVDCERSGSVSASSRRFCSGTCTSYET